MFIFVMIHFTDVMHLDICVVQTAIGALGTNCNDDL